jgi:hypothetical protein
MVMNFRPKTHHCLIAYLCPNQIRLALLRRLFGLTSGPVVFSNLLLFIRDYDQVGSRPGSSEEACI